MDKDYLELVLIKTVKDCLTSLREEGVGRQEMKSWVDEVCNEYPLSKLK